ncbi:Protein of uncharacterised function (DUF551) [Yersinia frederiksenii]|nr:Protein of uncharacterised function (DUF551) [Yersinia frederiksenii]
MKELDSFTVERLEEIIAEEGYSAMRTPKNDEVRALARIALAAKRAEPCGYAHKNAIKFDLHDTCRLHEQAGDENFIALYTTPQLNSPEIPDGWINCSDQMPEVGDVVITAYQGCTNVGQMERSGKTYRYFTSIASGRELPATHWMPLPAAPEKPL